MNTDDLDTKEEAQDTLSPKSTDTASEKSWKQQLKEWGYHIISSVIIVAFIKWIAFDIYVIPTPSMEGSLLVGDFLLVSKLSYGAHTPRTPLQIPLTNGTIWGTDIPSYLDWIQLPSYALPGIGNVEPGEMVVFHYPAETERPPDIRTFYVKRCIGTPGNTLSIKKGRVLINQKAVQLLPTQQRRYILKSSKTLNPRIFTELNIWEIQRTNDGYVFHSTRKQADQLASKPFISVLKPLILPPRYFEPYIFPQRPNFDWNIDQFGPLRVPQKNWRIPLTDSLLAIYGSTILQHEDLSQVAVKNDTLYINQKAQTHYTFTKDYYFMMGDNRHNSQDSRYWGFVPEDHIVGKPKLCIMSFDKEAPFWKSFRWSRFFKPIE